MASRQALRTTSITMAAAPDKIFDLVSPVERWPDLLPHYRRVSVDSTDAHRKTCRMSAWRGWIPVSWQALVSDDPSGPTLTFTHIGGFTRGMEVEWRFQPGASSSSTSVTNVTIIHRLDSIPGPLRRWLSERLVAPFFIDHIARRTLRRFKELAEST